ncbi:MAG: hypothetical protein OZ928_10775 [Polyangiaceae bacterium]|nr:hypothetical protein [Polyangiaceae bacterium]
MRSAKLVLFTLWAAASAALSAVGCTGADSFENCAETKTCAAAAGADAGLSDGAAAGAAGTLGAGGAPSTGGSAGLGGAAGVSGAAGAAGVSGAAGAAGVSGAAGAAGVSGAGAAGAGGNAGAAGSGIVLATPGSPCANGTECASGLCTDGVCCTTSCDGACERCDLAGSEGTCSPVKTGEDPDGECAATPGTSAPCDGACNGSGACAYPGAAVPCGTSTCASGTQTNPVCDGAGACAPTTASCSPYACGATACNTSCTKDAHCGSDSWCDGATCQPKQPNSSLCGAPSQCSSGHCQGGFCCNLACASPSNCASGQCRCNGAVCAAGHSCITWHYDADGDGYAGTSATKDVPGCDNLQPAPISGKKFYKTATDCDDGNADVHPGQTAWFDQATARGSWDYDCSGANETEYLVTYDPSGGPACRRCPSTPFCPIYSPYGYTCSGCVGDVVKVFKTLIGGKVIDCGTKATLSNCTSTGAETSTPNVTQRCH